MSSQEKSWGCAGVGRHAEITAELDEPLDGEGLWRLQLTGRSWSLRWAVSGKEDIRALAEFVAEHTGKASFATFEAGSFYGADVVITKDSEFEDRFFLRCLSAGLMTEITIQDLEAASLGQALADLVLNFDS